MRLEVPAQAGVPDPDLCIVFGTLFENAALALSRQAAGPRCLTARCMVENGHMVPAGLDSGDYYPLVTLYRVGQVLDHPTDPAQNGQEGTAPVAQVTGYAPIQVTNATLNSATAGNVTATPGPNQSLGLTFDGASQDGDYSAVTAAGQEISAYQIALYDQNGDPVLTKNTDALDQSGKRVPADPIGSLIPYTVRKALTYGVDGPDPAGQDERHSLDLSGLEPGTYTVGVTPPLPRQGRGQRPYRREYLRRLCRPGRQGRPGRPGFEGAGQRVLPHPDCGGALRGAGRLRQPPDHRHRPRYQGDQHPAGPGGPGHQRPLPGLGPRQLAVSVNGPAGHNATEAVQFTKYAAEDFSALVLSPSGLTFSTTGTAKVAGGILTAGAGTSTVTVKLGSLTSNVLTVSGEKKVEPEPEPTPSGGGGGANTYRVTAAPGVNGSFAVSPKHDAGYTVDTVLVTDSKGGKVAVTAQADGIYTFIMPARTVTVSVTFRPAAWENPFTDVAESDWFYPHVAYVHQKGLFAGTSDTAFSPNVTMSRAMLWTVLARMDGQDATGGTTWYERGRAWTMAVGISDGTDPEGPVTREQVAAMLYRYAEAKGADVSARADLSQFGDAPSVSAWAAEALAWASAGGIVTGKPGELLDPQGRATRAEAAAMLQRAALLF